MIIFGGYLANNTSTSVRDMPSTSFVLKGKAVLAVVKK
jgi:hypothetical protein